MKKVPNAPKTPRLHARIWDSQAPRMGGSYFWGCPRLCAQALDVAVLGLHFFARCSAVNASTSPPPTVPQTHSTGRSVRRLETLCLPGGGNTGRRIVRHRSPLAGVSATVRDNARRTIGNPFGNPSTAARPTVRARVRSPSKSKSYGIHGIPSFYQRTRSGPGEANSGNLPCSTSHQQAGRLAVDSSFIRHQDSVIALAAPIATTMI
jgi:hypothetical protein